LRIVGVVGVLQTNLRKNYPKIAPQFRKVLYKWTPQEAKSLHGLKNLFQAMPPYLKISCGEL
jgi:hypothetical protein